MDAATRAFLAPPTPQWVLDVAAHIDAIGATPTPIRHPDDHVERQYRDAA